MLTNFLTAVDELGLKTAINVERIAYLEEQSNGHVHVHFVGTQDKLITQGQLATRLRELMSGTGSK
jgi:hypothetical protein